MSEQDADDLFRLYRKVRDENDDTPEDRRRLVELLNQHRRETADEASQEQASGRSNLGSRRTRRLQGANLARREKSAP